MMNWGIIEIDDIVLCIWFFGVFIVVVVIFGEINCICDVVYWVVC